MNTSLTSWNVLWLDDNQKVLTHGEKRLRRWFESVNLRFMGIRTLREFTSSWRKGLFDLILLDLDLGSGFFSNSGFEAYEIIRKFDSKVPVVFASAFLDGEDVAQKIKNIQKKDSRVILLKTPLPPMESTQFKDEFRPIEKIVRRSYFNFNLLDVVIVLLSITGYSWVIRLFITKFNAMPTEVVWAFISLLTISIAILMYEFYLVIGKRNK